MQDVSDTSEAPAFFHVRFTDFFFKENRGMINLEFVRKNGQTIKDELPMTSLASMVEVWRANMTPPDQDVPVHLQQQLKIEICWSGDFQQHWIDVLKLRPEEIWH